MRVMRVPAALITTTLLVGTMAGAAGAVVDDSISYTSAPR